MSTFSDLIAEFGDGALDDDLTAHVLDVAAAVRLHGKAGSVTLKLKFAEKGGGVIIDADVSSTSPSVKPSAFFYVADDGALSKRDPRQPQLPTLEDPARPSRNTRNTNPSTEENRNV